MNRKNVIKVGVSLAIFIIIFITVVFYNPAIRVTFNEESIKIKTIFYSDEAKYNEITDVYMINKIEVGKRKSGISIGKVMLGNFHNKEFENYRLYKKNYVNELIVIVLIDKTIIFNNDDNLISIYNKLLERSDIS